LSRNGDNGPGPAAIRNIIIGIGENTLAKYFREDLRSAHPEQLFA
jgi:hypothetical protein